MATSAEPLPKPTGKLAEDLGNWFLRLNGFFTIPNFIVHPDGKGGQRTDADILGVRFPCRSELDRSLRPLRDHSEFQQYPVPLCLIAEVTTRGPCKLNGPWTDKEKENVQRVLSAIAVVPWNGRAGAAADLYARGLHRSESMHVRLCSLGEHKSDQLIAGALQFTWHDVLQWIFGRMTDHLRQKADCSQWDQMGKDLYSTAEGAKEESEFVLQWRKKLGHEV